MFKYSFKIVFAFAALLLTNCSDMGKVKINGTLENKQGVVYLERIGAGGSVVVDSVELDKKGKFTFDIELPDGQPTIYNIRQDGEFIPLLLEHGEKVTIKSGDDMSTDYAIEGSEGSQEMQKLRAIMLEGSMKMDSIRKVFAAASEYDKTDVAVRYVNEYNRAKQRQIEFIVSNPSSLAALYALYQRFPNDNILYQGNSDIIYYKLVNDSASVRYPDSPYLTALKNDLETADSRTAMLQKINDQFASSSEMKFPDLNLPDIYGQRHRLSDLSGNVILIDFWTAEHPGCIANNQEMKERYEDWNRRGLEIYQVSIDTEKAVWVTSVQDQKLPWLTLCDFRGSASHATMAYNVRSVPANFLIDKNGNVVSRNIYGDPLYKKIDQLLAQ